jgi:rubredoxin
MNAQPKPRHCDVCQTLYTPARMGQKVCGVPCATKSAKKARKEAIEAARMERGQDRAKREAMKPRAKWLKEAEREVNKYCRLRDHADGCISCDKPATWGGQWHASHFRSVGASPATRFNTFNIHKACSICNNHLSGNIGAYEPRLIEKIGRARLDMLKSLNHNPRYSIEYLKRLRDVFARRNRRLEKRLEANSWV